MAARAVAVVGNTSAPASADKIGVSGEGVGSEAAVGTWRMRAVGDGCGGCDRCDRRGDYSSRRRAAANAGGQAQRAPSVSPGAEAGYGILKAGRLGDVLDDLRQRGTAVEECRKAVAISPNGATGLGFGRSAKTGALFQLLTAMCTSNAFSGFDWGMLASQDKPRIDRPVAGGL